MNLEQLGRRDARLADLLRQSGMWRKLDAQIKALVPANLHGHFQTACIGSGRLVLLAANNMAASRLKMIVPVLLPRLREIDGTVEEVVVKIVPKPPKPPKTNSLRLSKAALAGFDAAAAKLEEKHPELAEALACLVKRHSGGE